jgi:Asp-tRNA(Asn)/Glu-tRNA(Gln) amidotransferase C subunit
MARFASGKEAADYIYEHVIPKVRKCAAELSPTATKKERLAAQIECVLKAFGKVEEEKPEAVAPTKRKSSVSSVQSEVSE